jgi:hypothetical protein
MRHRAMHNVRAAATCMVASSTRVPQISVCSSYITVISSQHRKAVANVVVVLWCNILRFQRLLEIMLRL